MFETMVSPGGQGRGRLVLQLKVLRRQKLDAGNKLRIELKRTSDPGVPVLPEDLHRALQLRPAARRYFDNLTPSARRWVVRHLDDARSPQTRTSRLERFIEAFAEHESERKAQARTG